MKDLLTPAPQRTDVEEMQRSTNQLIAHANELVAQAKIHLEELRRSRAARAALLEQRRRQKDKS